MENKIISLLLLLYSSIGIIFVSCSNSDDEENVSPEKLANLLQERKWEKRDVSYHEGSGNHAWLDDVKETLYFTSEDSGIAYIVTKDTDTDLGNSRYTDWYMFSYYISGNTVIVTDESSNITNYLYAGGRLVNANDIYESFSLTSGDREILRKIGPKTGQCGSNLKYTVDERKGIITISGNGEMYNYDNGNTPWGNYNIHKLIVNEGCNSIGNFAFYRCDLTDIDLCNSIKKIGDGAFRMTNISRVNIPIGIQTIGKYSFAECSSLRDVNFAGCDELSVIDEAAFWGSKVNFGYFTMPKNVTTIGNFAFCNSTFKSLTLNEKLTCIGGGAFMNLNFTKLVIPNSVTTIKGTAFMGSFSELRIGTGLTNITGTPFASSRIGSMYVSTTSPKFFPQDSYEYLIMDNSGANVVPKWNLYVPKGCKSNYSKNAVWGKFRRINEYSSL